MEAKLDEQKRFKLNVAVGLNTLIEHLKAPRAKDVDQWLSAPNRFDLPNVDTNKPKKSN